MTQRFYFIRTLDTKAGPIAIMADGYVLGEAGVDDLRKKYAPLGRPGLSSVFSSVSRGRGESHFSIGQLKQHLHEVVETHGNRGDVDAYKKAIEALENKKKKQLATETSRPTAVV